MISLKHVFVVFLMIGMATSVVAQSVWLSNKIPTEEKKSIRPLGMHHLASVSAGRRKVKIVQWLMLGEQVEDAKYFTTSSGIESLVLAPSGKNARHQLDTLNQRIILSFFNPEEGFYNAYVAVKEVRGDTLFYALAKGELLNHSCRNGHAHVREMMPSKHYPEQIPLEIIRERMSHEDFHYYVSSGEEVAYKVLLNGKPANRVRMKLSTEKGWINTKHTDESGMVVFQFLQDYFTPWQELNNREEYTYVLFANVTVEQPGEYQGQPYNYIKYTASLSDAYRPAKTFYQSMFWSIIVLLLTTFGVVGGVYYYRSRRNKPFKEIVFDEAN